MRETRAGAGRKAVAAWDLHDERLMVVTVVTPALSDLWPLLQLKAPEMPSHFNMMLLRPGTRSDGSSTGGAAAGGTAPSGPPFLGSRTPTPHHDSP